MKMRLLSITSVILFILSGTIYAQNFDDNISKAKSSYKSGDLDGARFALQEALNEVNTAIGKEVLELLPKTMKDMANNDSEDNVNSSGAGFSGLNVNRTYGNSETGKSADITIITDSPLIAGINSILSLPAIMTSGADSNQKRIKVGSYKALLQINDTEDGKKNYDVQVPFGSSLLTFHCDGYTESDVVTMANTIPVAKIDEKTR